MLAVTTHQILGELDARGVRFLTLRMRSPGLTRQIASLPAAAYTTVTLDRTGRYTKPKVHEPAGVKLTNYPSRVTTASGAGSTA